MERTKYGTKEKIRPDTPLRSIRKFCLQCGNGTYSNVRNCRYTDCPLWLLRLGKYQGGKSARKAIREFCLYCMNGQRKEVSRCKNTNCPFYPRRNATVKVNESYDI